MSFRISWNSSIAALCVFALLYVISTGVSVTHTKLKLRPRMDITYDQIELPDGVIKYKFQKNGASLSFGDALTIMVGGQTTLTDSLSDIIAGYRAPAVFWECISVTPQSLETTGFEFVLLPAARLDSVTSDIIPFKDQCASHDNQITGSSIATFYNLNKDALLVVPCPAEQNHYQTPPAYMAHLAAFIRGESHARSTEFWRTVAVAMTDTLKHSAETGNNRLWLSTSGLGVSWLHVRIDTRPKYYNWAEYKNV